MKTIADHMRVMHSRPGTGKGLFAARPYTKGEFIVEYTGVKIPTKVADTLKTRYLFELDEKWTIDGNEHSNIARYINHSCEPNAESEIHDEHIFVTAIQDIAAGEEFTMDYGEEYFEEFIRPEGCKCRAATHRV